MVSMLIYRDGAMAIGSGIEWTEATWNPTTGCSKVSSGYTHCYAETLTKRLHAMGQPKYRNGFAYSEHPSAVNLPLGWKKPRRIFVNSMSDLFHEHATPDFVWQCFEVMLKANWHTYQILTKRPRRMADFSERFEEHFNRTIPKHIWLGTSIEDADTLFRLEKLRKARCEIRFISFEPLLGSIGPINLDDIHWVIVGGESGAGYRPVKKEWVLDIIEQCRYQNIPIFFKQWGGPRPKSNGLSINGKEYDQYPTL